MAHQHSSNRNRRSHSAKALRRGVLGLGTSAGAALAFGMDPLIFGEMGTWARCREVANN